MSPYSKGPNGRKLRALQRQLKILIDEQSETRKTAVFRGMNPDEAREYSERHDKMLGLLQEIKELER